MYVSVTSGTDQRPTAVIAYASVIELALDPLMLDGQQFTVNAATFEWMSGCRSALQRDNLP